MSESRTTDGDAPRAQQSAVSRVLGALDAKKIASWAVIGLYLVLVLTPFLFTLLTSVKSNAALTQTPVAYWPVNFTLDPYITVLFEQAYGRYLLNTLLVALSVAFLCAVFGIPAAYALARYRLPFQAGILYSAVSIRLIPPIALMVPFFLLIRLLGAIDTLAALVLVNFMLNLPFFIWIAWGFFKDLDWSCEEAALIDGCTRIDALWRVTIPMAAPGLAAAAIVSFLFTWNEYLFALTFSQTEASKTIAVGISDFIGDVFVRWNLICAAGIITTIPALVFVFAFQRYIIRGLGGGGVKG